MITNLVILLLHGFACYWTGIEVGRRIERKAR